MGTEPGSGITWSILASAEPSSWTIPEERKALGGSSKMIKGAAMDEEEEMERVAEMEMRREEEELQQQQREQEEQEEEQREVREAGKIWATNGFIRFNNFPIPFSGQMLGWGLMT